MTNTGHIILNMSEDSTEFKENCLQIMVTTEKTVKSDF